MYKAVYKSLHNVQCIMQRLSVCTIYLALCSVQLTKQCITVCTLILQCKSVWIMAMFIDCTLPAKYSDSVDLKDGLLNSRVCAVKFPAIESGFSSNTTHTEVSLTRMDLEVW